MGRYWEARFVVDLDDTAGGDGMAERLRAALRAYQSLKIGVEPGRLRVGITVGPTDQPEAAAEYAFVRLSQAVDHGEISSHAPTFVETVDLGY